MYKKPNEIKKNDDNKIPKLIHRTLLYDSDFPENVKEYINSFNQEYPDYDIILWHDQDVRDILELNELIIYDKLKKIQKSDFARYIILKKFGGMYVDFDIFYKSSLNNFIENINLHHEGIVFIEHVHKLNKQCNLFKKYKIRENKPEDKIRIANYLMIFKSNSNFIQECINLLIQRSHLNIENDYDILYTTGPDILSTVYARYNKNNLQIINLKESLIYFIHKCSGHWRKYL
jgi:mannosyltransferase OCH1-like enzyme